ncbi:MAG TPA: DinB family protein [Candidatus Limnocylindria bacterium]|nr:DinB family protein [Candidatus Limnocylindria bacterium]
MAHPLIDQLRFTRSEFLRGIRGVSEGDSTRRLDPMNSIGWNVGHLAWQEQQYFITWPSGRRPFPDIDREFVSGGPPSTPALERVLTAWKAITADADRWLDTVTSEALEAHVMSGGRQIQRRYGDLVQRVIYHYWFHTGENAAIRQMLGHGRLPQFVGSIDTKAPYRPDR